MPEVHLTPFVVPDRRGKPEVPAIAIRSLPCVLGRARACDQRIDDPMISRRHCAFSLRDGQVWVEDLASRNGTRLDGEPVVAPRPVADGATLQLARLTFTVQLEGSPDSCAGNPTAGGSTGKGDPAHARTGG